jgi:hypothetical protein
MMFRAVLIALLAFTPLPAAVAEMTRLHITVKTLDGKPIEHAAVTIKFVEGRTKIIKKATTTWETRSNQEGYQTFGEIFTVNEEDKTIEVKMNPPQPQYSAHQ